MPRPSKKEEKIRQYLVDFAAAHGLSCKTDEAGNVLVSKAASARNSSIVCCSNRANSAGSAITPALIISAIPARNSRSGSVASNEVSHSTKSGCGVAAELAVLAADDIEHGPIECLFTVDEETGLTGAFALKEGFMDGDILINLDSEDEGELFIGCAGGAGTTAEFSCPMVKAPEGWFFFRVAVKGLTGGHSGDDINKNRANANKLLNRYLTSMMQRYGMRLCEIGGGNLHNAIPREASAVCAVPMEYKEAVRVDLNVYLAEVEEEYSVTEPNLAMELESETPRKEVMEPEAMRRFLLAVYAVHNGVYMMSQDIPGLVETSSNLASVKQRDGKIVIVTSQRSSILSSRKDMSRMVSAAFELGGATCVTADGYPGWKPDPHSEILGIAVESYRRLFGVEPKVKAIHAGLSLS